jgi:hypothetical protein
MHGATANGRWSARAGIVMGLGVMNLGAMGLGALVSLVFGFGSGHAMAQSVDGSSPVPRAADILPSLPFEPRGLGLGYRVGRFVVQPAVATGLAYDDNIDADNDDRVDDFIWVGAVGVRAQALLRRHAFGFDATAGTSRYFQNSSEDEVNWVVGADGRLDLTRRSQLAGRVSYTRAEESRESVDRDADADDSVFHQVNSSLTYDHRFTRTSLSVATSANRTEFENSDEADRDRWRFRVAPSVSYDIRPRLTADLSPSYARTAYDTEDEAGRDQDEEDYEIQAGLSYTVSPRLSTRGFVGYSWFRPADDDEDDEHGVTFGGSLTYAVGERTTASLAARRTIREDTTVTFTGSLAHALDSRTSVGLAASRSFRDTNVDGASSSINTSVSGNIRRVIRSDMALTASAGAAREEFQGIDREDDSIFARLGYDWAFHRAVSLNVSYRYSQRFADDANDDFYRNIVFIGLTARL